MANTADDYAKWIVANEHLKGTPDFETVAKAYQEAKAQEAQAPQEPDNGVVNTLHAGVDNAVNNIGSTVAHGGADFFNNLLTINKDGKEVFNLGKTLGLTNDAQWRGVGKTIADSVDAPENYQSPQVLKDPNAAWNDWGNYDLSQLPRAALEQAPNMAAALGATALFGAPGAIAYGAGQTYGPTLDERMKNNGYTDPSQLTLADKDIAAGTALGAGALEAIGFKGSSKLATKALTKLAQKGVAGRVTSNVAAKAGRLGAEGVTEGIQDFAEQAGGSVGTEKGFSPDGAQAIAAGLTGAASRGITMAPTAPIELIDTVMGPQYKAKNKQAAARLAQRMQERVTRNDLDTGDLETQQYANATSKEVVKGEYVDLGERIKFFSRQLMPLLRKETPDLAEIDFDNFMGLGTDSNGNAITDPLSDEAIISFNSSLRSGKNLHIGVVDKSTIDMIRNKFGHLEEGQQLANALEESVEFKRFHDSYRKGATGGILGSVANTRPVKFLKSRLGSNLTSGLTGGAIGSGSLAALLEPTTLIGTGAAAALTAGAYGIDKFTGRRNKVDRFLKDYGSDSVPLKQRLPGMALQDYLNTLEEASRVENENALRAQDNAAASDRRAREAHKETSTRLFREALNAFQSNDPNYAIPDRSWLAENSDYLTDGHYNALEKRIRLNEERAAKDEKDYNKQVEDEFRNRILKDLTDASRGGGRIPPEMLEQYKPFLKPAEYDMFVTRQNVEDKRVVAFAYQMANQKAAQAEAEAKADERLARELERDNRRAEAAQAREAAATKRAKAAQDKADAKAVADSVKAELARMKYTGTLNYDYINDHADILGPQINTWLNALKAQQKAERKAREDETKKNKGRGKTHRGARGDAAIPTQPQAAPQPTPAVSAEAIGDPNNPVRSSYGRTGMNTGQVREEEAFKSKIAVTEAMQNAILATADAYLGTEKDGLGFALKTFVELIAGKGEEGNRVGGARNNPEERFKAFKDSLSVLLDDKEAVREFREETEQLMLAFGNPEGYVKWASDNRDTSP